MKTKKVEKAISSCLDVISHQKLTREELVVLLGQLLIRSGFSIHWLYENPIEKKPEKITSKEAEDLYYRNPSTGTTLMKIGFDLQEVLLLSNKQ